MAVRVFDSLMLIRYASRNTFILDKPLISHAPPSAMSRSDIPVPLLPIENRILLIRGQKVMVDADLADLYGVQTKALNQAVKRNAERFPSDFMFQLTADEKLEVVTNCDHLARLKYSRTLPFVFTEHGAIQASNVLASPQAIEMGLYVVRTFVRLREVLASHKELASRLDSLERKTEALALQHDAFARNTRVQLKQVFDAVRELMKPPEATPKRAIGFIELQEKSPRTKPKARKRNG
jgi:hypothetical protein